MVYQRINEIKLVDIKILEICGKNSIREIAKNKNNNNFKMEDGELAA